MAGLQRGGEDRSRVEALIPRGPKGQKRPADVIGNAVRVMRIATGETRLWSMEDVVALIDEQAERSAPNLADRLVG
jgi:hypothetical protein